MEAHEWMFFGVTLVAVIEAILIWYLDNRLTQYKGFVKRCRQELEAANSEVRIARSKVISLRNNR